MNRVRAADIKDRRRSMYLAMLWNRYLQNVCARLLKNRNGIQDPPAHIRIDWFVKRLPEDTNSQTFDTIFKVAHYIH